MSLRPRIVPEPPLSEAQSTLAEEEPEPRRAPPLSLTRVVLVVALLGLVGYRLSLLSKHPPRS